MDTPTPRPLIAVFGSSIVTDVDPAWRLGYDLGKALAGAGAGVMTGGYHGTMEAVSRGAHEAGGHVVGVTVDLFERRGPANRWLLERVHMPTLYDRLRYLVEHATGFVTLPGSIGTLTELFLAWTMLSTEGRERAPLVLLGEHWPDFLRALRHRDMVLPQLFDVVQHARTPAEAARLALAHAGDAARARGQ